VTQAPRVGGACRGVKHFSASEAADVRRSARQRNSKPQEPTMKTFFAALTVLTLVFGTVAFAVPAHASKTYLFAPHQNEGGQG
jgi:hypothetical protein